MNATLETALRSRRVWTRDGQEVPLNSEISAREGKAIQDWMHAVEAQVTLEVGCAHGVSTLFMCEALADIGRAQARHVVIDPHQSQGWQGVGLEMVRRAGYAHLVELHEEPSHATLPRLVSQGVSIDFALIDGWHTFDYALVDFFYIDLLLKPGCIVVLDDTRCTAVRKLARYIARNRQYVALPNPGTPQATTRTERLCEAVTAPARWWPPARHLLRPEWIRTDAALGLPPDNFVAFRKVADDLLGNGTGGTRRWDQHEEF